MERIDLSADGDFLLGAAVYDSEGDHLFTASAADKKTARRELAIYKQAYDRGERAGAAGARALLQTQLRQLIGAHAAGEEKP